MKININLPTSEKDIRQIKIGDVVSLNGIIMTARDKAHKYIYENMIKHNPRGEDKVLYEFLKQSLYNGAIYHCGPIVSEKSGIYTISSAGPTTSIREEFYTHHLIKDFSIRAIIGKGGMGNNTKDALQKYGCVYLHAVGGSAVVYAEQIRKVVDVRKKEFGIPEAMWLLKVDNFTTYASMDSHGNSIHDKVKTNSESIFNKLF